MASLLSPEKGSARLHFTRERMDAYERNRERKLRGEWLDDGEWFAMMDAAKALRDHRIMQLQSLAAAEAAIGSDNERCFDNAQHHAFTIAGGPLRPSRRHACVSAIELLGSFARGPLDGAPGMVCDIPQCEASIRANITEETGK